MLLKHSNLPQYLDDLLKIDNLYFEQIVSQIYPKELQLNQTHSFEAEAHFVDDLKKEKRAGSLYFNVFLMSCCC